MRKHIINKEIFLNEDAISFYLLGAYMADGNVCLTPRFKNLNIVSKDKDWLEIIRDLVSKSINLQHKNNCYTLKIFDLDILNWLTSYGCSPNKSLKLAIDKEIPKQYIRDFIRGVLDGDGSISISEYSKKKNGKIYKYKKINTYICSASETFVKQISGLISPEINRSLIEIKPGKSHFLNGREITSKTSIWRLHFNDSNAKKLLAWLYNDNQIAIPRKNKIAKIIIAG